MRWISFVRFYLLPSLSAFAAHLPAGLCVGEGVFVCPDGQTKTDEGAELVAGSQSPPHAVPRQSIAKQMPRGGRVAHPLHRHPRACPEDLPSMDTFAPFRRDGRAQTWADPRDKPEDDGENLQRPPQRPKYLSTAPNPPLPYSHRSHGTTDGQPTIREDGGGVVGGAEVRRLAMS